MKKPFRIAATCSDSAFDRIQELFYDMPHYLLASMPCRRPAVPEVPRHRWGRTSGTAILDRRPAVPEVPRHWIGRDLAGRSENA